MTREVFHDFVKDALENFSDTASSDADCVQAFLKLVEYVVIDAEQEQGWDALSTQLRPDVVRVFYLSVAPSLFGPIGTRLKDSGCTTADARIVVEKPFGHDLPSAQALNEKLLRSFSESQIYRIDHYLGKETVQNLMLCALPIPCLNRFGMPPTLITSRSPWQRMWG